MNLDELEALARAATPGPWRAANGNGSASVACADCAIYLNVRTCEVDECIERWQADARYIAAASPDTVLALIDRVRRLGLTDAEREALRWLRAFLPAVHVALDSDRPTTEAALAVLDRLLGGGV